VADAGGKVEAISLRVVGGLVGLLALAAVAVALAAPGQIDPGFRGDGKVRTDLGGEDWGGWVASVRGGSLVVAGGSDGNVAVTRYDASGRLDPGFGGDGKVVTDLGDIDSAWALAVQPDGKVVVAGQSGSDVALVRYLVDGTLDRTFGADGVAVTDFGGRERSIALLRSRDGRLVVVAAAPDRLLLARYLRDGRLDSSFGRRGFVFKHTPGLEWRSFKYCEPSRGRAESESASRGEAASDPMTALAPCRRRGIEWASCGCCSASSE
jgi:uncharacterized delta-60 repeat protein